MALFPKMVLGIRLLTGRAFSHPAGNSPLTIDLNSAASSGYFFSYSANFEFHSASNAAPSGTWRLQCLYRSGNKKSLRNYKSLSVKTSHWSLSYIPHFLTSSGTWNGSYGQARFCLVASTSLEPSAAPCTLYELALFGDP